MSCPRILVTGAGGMVGRNLLAHPRAAAFEFLAPSSHELDLRDYAATEAFIRGSAPDMILHLAGRSWGIQAIAQEPVRSFLEILDIGRNILVAARESGVARLINIGTSSMYPVDAADPLREDQILSGPFEPNVEPYALAKVAILRLCQYMDRKDGMSFKTLIPCNLYGPNGRFGPDESVLIPAVMYRLHEARSRALTTVPIWGDGSARREFMYAGDFADLLINALERFETLPEVLNVGVGEDHSVAEYYRAIAEIVGYSGSFGHDLSRPVGFKRKLLDVERLRKWGWSARTTLRDGLRATYGYFNEHAATGGS